MEIKYYMVLLLLLISTISFSQGITIGSGTTFSLGSGTFTLTGNWNNSGTFNAQNGSVIFAGTSSNQTISKTGGETFNNLTVTKAAGNIQLLSNITVTGSLTLTSGDIDLNSNILTLGSSAILSESAGSTVKGLGRLTTIKTLNSPSSVNILGIEITSTANMGSTVITRGHAQQSHGGNYSILRYFDITPTNNKGLNASLVFHYDHNELNDLTENDLVPFHSKDGGTNWILAGGSSINISNNTVSFNGLSALSRFTLAENSNPLPVELTSFTASYENNSVILKWQTASELNNYGFEIEKTTSGSAATSLIKEGTGEGWTKIAFFPGAGNSNSLKDYSYIDKSVFYGEFTYRLKQIDYNGQYKYSDEIKVTAGTRPSAYKLTNYPDPFNPITTIMIELPEADDVNVSLYNIIGEKVATVLNGDLTEGIYKRTFDGRYLTSGFYILVLRTEKNISIVKKIMLVK